MSYLSTNFLLKYIFSDSMQLWFYGKMIPDIQKKVKIKYLKASKNSTFQLTLSGADLDCSFRTMLLTQCTVCNVTLFWHHLDILLSSSAHQIRHIYLVKCLIMFLLPKSIYYLVAPRLWSLMLFKKNGTPITLKDSIVVSKGQLFSKCLFGVFNFLQKTNENKSTWGIIVVKLNFFVLFLE